MKKHKILGIMSFCIILFSIFNFPNLNSQYLEIENIKSSTTPKSSNEINLNSSSVSNFFDDFVPTYINEMNMAGMTISAVQNDTILFSKGYGYANIEQNKLVDSNRTLFRIASISKVITMIGIMQLVEQGLIDLHVDLNSYLSSFQIPETFSEPITLYHLLTHSTGFEDIPMMIYKDSDGIPLSLEEICKINLPKRIRPPGSILSYSSYTITFVGFLIEAITSQAFEKYINEHIFIPLGMNSSTFIQPIPSHLEENLAQGYAYKDGNFYPKKSPISSNRPAGAVSSTALDLGKFMLAILNNGTYNGIELLKSETIDLILSKQISYFPEMPSVCFTFWEDYSYGQRILIHTGDRNYFHSKMMLFPELNFGLFFSFNTWDQDKYSTAEIATAYKLQWDFGQKFLEYFFSNESTIISSNSINGGESRLKEVVGTYRITVFPFDNIGKSLFLFAYSNSVFKLTANENRTLNFNGITLIETSPYIYQSFDGQYLIGFIKDENGKIAYAQQNIHPTFLLEKLAWHETPKFQYILLFMILMVFILSLIYWMSSFIYRKFTKKPRQITLIRKSQTLGMVVSIFGIFTLFMNVVYWLFLFDYDESSAKTAKFLMILPILSIFLVGFLIYYSICLWKKKIKPENKSTWNNGVNIHYTIFTIIQIFFIYFLKYWNFFGF